MPGDEGMAPKIAAESGVAVPPPGREKQRESIIWTCAPLGRVRRPLRAAVQVLVQVFDVGLLLGHLRSHQVTRGNHADESIVLHHR